MSAKVKISLFGKTEYREADSSDENWTQKMKMIISLRQNIGHERNFRVGSKLTILIGAQKKGLLIMAVEQDLGVGEWILKIEARSLAIEKAENSEYLSRFGLMEGREFIGYGEVIETDLG